MAAPEPLAIVGLGCRFPGGSSSPAAFWRLLAEGRDAIEDGPPEAWREAVLRHPDALADGGYVRDVDGFDWRAFKVSPRVARSMDPQQRLMLEVAWEAFEDAGMPFERLRGAPAGVFVGIMWPDYAKLVSQRLDQLDGYVASGNAFAYAANRISAFWDLTGPSLSLDVMCASSLVAVHLACQALWSGECELALAGGVNLILSPDTNVAMTRARILSPTGRCHTFDAAADGFVRGEGAGAVVLKPHARALADGDRVYALVRGSAANHNGRAEWIMAPTEGGQERLVRAACRRAGVEPRELGYVEVHGTGTAKGDPVEAAALGATVGAGRPAGERCRVGSVKTNIGHLDSAAGVAGLVKAALVAHRGEIPPSLHFETPNPAIDFEALGIEVQRELGPWPGDGARRLAGVTALSFGGGNAHVVLEGVDAESPPVEDGATHVLPVSAESEGALRELLAAWAAELRGDGDGEPPPARDACWTAAARRTHRRVRAAVVGADARELADALEAAARADLAAGPVAEEGPVLVFSGQGSSWPGMCGGLLGERPFRDALEHCDAALSALAGWSLVEAIESGDERLAADGDPALVQPATYGVQVALTALWRAWGVEPVAVVGHSVGEIAAAHVAGALSLEDGMRVACERGALMAAVHGRGRTAQLALAPADAERAVASSGGRVWVAGLNGPESTLVAGEPAAVEALCEELRGRGVLARVLPVRSAFHGGELVELAPALDERLAGIRPARPAVPTVSTLTGAPVEDGEFDAADWARQVAEPVRLLPALEHLVASGRRAFLEVAPHPVLRPALREALSAAGARDGLVLGSVRRGRGGRAELLASLAALYAHGQDVRWEAVVPRGRVVSLPPYRWQRDRLWLDEGAPARRAAEARAQRAPAHPLLGAALELAADQPARVVDATLDPRAEPWLAEHRVGGSLVAPGSCVVELAAAAARELLGWQGCRLRELAFERPLHVTAGAPTRVQLRLTGDGGELGLELFARGEGDHARWTRCASARLDPLPAVPLPAVDASAARERAAELASDELYARFERMGVDYGAAFRGIERAWCDGARVAAEVRAPDALATAGFGHHPALLDACMHAIAVGLPDVPGPGFMPTHVDELRVYAPASAALRVDAAVAPFPRGGGLHADITIAAADGAPLVDVAGIRLVALGSRRDRRDRTAGRLFYRVEWEPVAPAAAPRELARERIALLADGGGTGAALARLLRARGAEVVVVPPDADPERALDGASCAVHLCALDVPAHGEAGAAERARSLALESTVALARGLSRGDPDRRAPIWLFTRGAQAVAADEAPAALAAQLWGLGRALAQELPGLWGGLADLDPAASAEASAASALAAIDASGGEDQLAVRGERLLAPRLVKAGALPAARAALVEAGSAYVVTGGFGGLGLLAAQRLAERGAGALVLAGRRGLPPREQWERLPADHPAHERVAAVRRLEQLGAAVHPVALDVADAGALAGALAELRAAGLPAVRGALHAAGVVELRPLLELDARALREATRAKVEGALALADALAGEPLAWLGLFSSTSALLSSPRLGAYAAGNAFLGALAHALRADGVPATAIDWGLWGESGMGVTTQGGPAALRGHRALDPERGLALLERALGVQEPELAAMELDWDEWRAFYPRAASAPLLRRLTGDGGEAPQPGAAARPAAAPQPARDGANAAAPAGDRQARVLALVAEVLRVRALDPSQPLEGFGFDSLMAAELRARIEDETGVRIPVLRLLEAETPEELARQVLDVEGGEE